MNKESWKFLMDFVLALVDLIKVAIDEPDPDTLKKVFDILPSHHVMKSRAALVVAEAQARKDLADA